MIEIREVKTKKEQKDFLDFPLKLYKNNPYFVPPLYGDEKKIFRKDYVYYDQAEAVYFNAYDDGKIVGRISGILQHASNQKMNEKRVRFTRFHCIDSQEVANKLFEAVENWAKEKGMDTVCGPLGFSDLEREGLLVEGFDYLSTFEEEYNFDYYPKLIENLGYTKEVDWVERRLYHREDVDPRLEKVTEYLMKKYNLHYGKKMRSTKAFLKKYSDGIFELIDVTYDNLYGTVPFTDNMKKLIMDNFALLIDQREIKVILDENEKVVCFAFAMPSIALAVQKSGGHLTIPCLIKLLKCIKKPKVLDLALIGVDPEYMKKGIGSIFILYLQKMLNAIGLEYAETNLNLEDNYDIQNEWKKFNSIQHKRRRSYVKKL